MYHGIVQFFEFSLWPAGQGSSPSTRAILKSAYAAAQQRFLEELDSIWSDAVPILITHEWPRPFQEMKAFASLTASTVVQSWMQVQTFQLLNLFSCCLDWFSSTVHIISIICLFSCWCIYTARHISIESKTSKVRFSFIQDRVDLILTSKF